MSFRNRREAPVRNLLFNLLLQQISGVVIAGWHHDARPPMGM
jgi:hypothetical protein